MNTMTLPKERKIILLDKNGQKIGEENLLDEFQIDNEHISLHLIHEVLEIERWNRRQGTRKTKTISEVSGGGRKPYRQKGTGYARQGSIRAPQFRGGATVFGPRPQDFYKKVNKKVRTLALKQVLNLKSSIKAIYKIEGFPLSGFSTKTVYQVLKRANLLPNHQVAIIHNNEPYLYHSSRNIENVNLIAGSRPTMPELFYSNFLLFTNEGFQNFLSVIR
ncbi:MAG: 50S ribosomal protein L4 [Leptospiraceae bacterium]|nr:50S ribosomal protein L4 [Leptospiraceae bacterium]MDW7975172.1 50S ribosomal protein L4 [Leptospiraceae bacterium]